MVTIPGVYVAWKILILLFTLLLGWVVKEINTFISYSKSGAKPSDDTVFKFGFAPGCYHTSLGVAFGPTPTSKVWPPVAREDEAT